MKVMKKITAGALACATLAASAAALGGCGSTWALKTDTAEMSSGVYRYALLYGYQYASYYVEDYTQPVFSQEIDGEPAEDYVRELALTYFIVPYLVTEEKMAELNLSLSDVERYNAEASADEDWASDDYASYVEMLESYGISKEDYQKVYYDYSAKYSKIFRTIYGEGGEFEVSREEMEEYINDYYSDIDYIVKPTSTLTDEELEELQTQLAADAKAINKGSKTLEEIVEEENAADADSEAADSAEESSDASAAESAAEDDSADAEDSTDATEIYSRIDQLSADSYPEELVNAVADMKDGKAQVVDATDSSGCLILVVKNELNEDSIAELLDNEDEDTKEENVFQLLIYMRQDDYTTYMNELCENFDTDSITYNPSETTDLNLAAIFEPDSLTSSDEETEAEASGESADSSEDSESSGAEEDSESGSDDSSAQESEASSDAAESE